MLHYIGGDYSFTSYIILLVHVSNGRRVVMVNSWVYVMTADNHVSRGSPLIGAARQSLPPGEMELESRFQRERTYFSYIEEIVNLLCKL